MGNRKRLAVLSKKKGERGGGAISVAEEIQGGGNERSA